MEIEGEVPHGNALIATGSVTLFLTVVLNTVSLRDINLNTLVPLTQQVLILLINLHLVWTILQHQISLIQIKCLTNSVRANPTGYSVPKHSSIQSSS